MNTDLIFKLSDAVSFGNLRYATELAKKELSKYMDVTDFGTLGIIGTLDKGAARTLMLDAHIDEVGFVVTSVLEDGFVKVANVGGIDKRILPATPVIIHGKRQVSAVFASTPPHLGKNEPQEITDILLDTGICENLEDIVSVGDFVSYDSKCVSLSGNRICGKSFDDRAAVACLIEVASRIYDKELPFNVVFCFTEQEELGLRGAKTASFHIDCDEAIAVDVSFGDAPDVPDSHLKKLGGGVMIGVSPILNKDITKHLTKLCEKNNIPFNPEVMGGTTGTDADNITLAKSGIPTGLLSIPLRNMHTPCEIIDLSDYLNTCNLLEAYILSGGAFND